MSIKLVAGFHFGLKPLFAIDIRGKIRVFVRVLRKVDDANVAFDLCCNDRSRSSPTTLFSKDLSWI